jgi:hypothetical protein
MRYGARHLPHSGGRRSLWRPAEAKAWTAVPANSGRFIYLGEPQPRPKSLIPQLGIPGEAGHVNMIGLVPEPPDGRTENFGTDSDQLSA